MDRREMLQTMISDYRKKIEAYEIMVREWETELGSSSGEIISKTTGIEKNGRITGTPVSLVHNYQFFNKSQIEATKLLLELVGHPLTTEEIIEGIEKGGVKIGGKNPKDKKTNFYTILHRSDEIGRAARNTWGLREWPNITIKKSGQSEEDKKEK